MTAGIVLLVALVVAVLVARTAARARRQREQRQQHQAHYEHVERPAMPEAIANGCLVLSEQSIASPRPRPLRARFDQVYAHAGELVVVETKTRKRPPRGHRKFQPTRYDQIELSVQAAILRHAMPQAWAGHRVAGHGWVRFKCEGMEPVYEPVPLLDDREVAALHDRFREVVSGRAQPRPARRASACRTCAYRSACPHPRSA